MNDLQKLIARFECGFINSPALLAELVTLDRLHPVLVRCGCGRFQCPAQDVEHFIRCVELGGDDIRDISLAIGSAERAAAWAPECPVTPINMFPESFATPIPIHHRKHLTFNESDCGGVFDGNQVTSDADSGL